VEISLGLSAKVLLLNEMLMQKVRPADLARRMKVTPQEVNRLTNLRTNVWIEDRRYRCGGEGAEQDIGDSPGLRSKSAHFWIEFKFGNWLVPRIERSLDLLPPEILALATESFGMSFAQGCHFG
jgi:hypothetical protein